MQEQKPNTQTMWGCMLAGDLVIRKVKGKAIVIVGDTRVGKSTLLNYLMKIPMQGYKQSRYSDVNARPSFQSGVQTKLSYQSCTLIPNIGAVTLGQQKIQLCDTAGFDDEGRPYYGIFGVSYMLQKIFQTVKEIKFILVVSHPAFENQKLADMIKPFINFFKIFKPQLLIREPEFAQKFISSIAIVSIKAREDTDYYLGKMFNALQQLTKEKDLPNDRKIVKMVFEQILENERLQIFRRAEDKKQIHLSTILENLSKPQKKWEYYNFEEYYSSSHIFQLPFARQYDRMKDTEKEKYKRDLANKKKLMSDSYQLLQQFALKGKQNWHSKEPINYDEEFVQLRKLIQGHPYGSLGLMLCELNNELLIPYGQQSVCTRLNLLQKFVEIQKAASQINAEQEYSQVHDKITAMMQPCKQVFEVCRKTFCRTREQEECFIVFMFINIRSLYQSQMQRKIHKSECAWVPFVVKDGITKIIEGGGAEDLTAQFFQGFVPTSQQRSAFTKIIDETVKDINKVIDPKQARHLLYVQVNNNIKDACIQIKAKRYKQGLQQALKANKMFQTFVEVLDEYEKQDQDIRKFKQITIFKKIAQCLQCMNLSRLAAEIYEHMGSVSLLIKCYEKLIDSKKKLKKKYEIMEDFAKILTKYDKKQKLIQLYQQMIDEFQCYPYRQHQIRQKLSTLLQKDLTEQRKLYSANLAETNKIDNNQQIIQKIEMQLNYYVEEDEQNQQSSDQDIDVVFEKRNEGIEQQEQEEYYND